MMLPCSRLLYQARAYGDSSAVKFSDNLMAAAARALRGRGKHAGAAGVPKSGGIHAAE